LLGSGEKARVSDCASRPAFVSYLFQQDGLTNLNSTQLRYHLGPCFILIVLGFSWLREGFFIVVNVPVVLKAQGGEAEACIRLGVSPGEESYRKN